MECELPSASEQSHFEDSDMSVGRRNSLLILLIKRSPSGNFKIVIAGKLRVILMQHFFNGAVRCLLQRYSTNGPCEVVCDHFFKNFNDWFDSCSLVLRDVASGYELKYVSPITWKWILFIPYHYRLPTAAFDLIVKSS